MKPYKLTPAARADIDGIVDYLLHESDAERAEIVVRKIFDAFSRLAEAPGVGHVREDLTDEQVRFWKVYSYHVIYRPDTSPLEVIAVISGWRDVGRELRRRP